MANLRFRAGFATKGIYDPTTEYDKLDTVSNSEETELYVSLRPSNINHPLSNTYWWQRVLKVPELRVDQEVDGSSPYAVSGAAVADALDGKQDASTAFSGSFNDLTDVPETIGAQVQADWDETDSESPAFIQNKPTIPEGVDLDDSVTPDGSLAVTGQGIYEALQPIKDAISSIEDELHPTELSLTTQNSVIEYTGTSTSVTFTAKLKRQNQEVTPDNIEIRCNYQTSVTQTLTVALTGRTTYLAEATAVLDNKTYTKSASVKIMHRMRIGFNASAVISSAAIASFTAQTLKNSVSGTYTPSNNSNTSQYLWVCIDDSLSISSFTSSGFTVPMEPPVALQGYKCYRSSEPIGSGTMTLVLS